MIMDERGFLNLIDHLLGFCCRCLDEEEIRLINEEKFAFFDAVDIFLLYSTSEIKVGIPIYLFIVIILIVGRVSFEKKTIVSNLDIYLSLAQDKRKRKM